MAKTQQEYVKEVAIKSIFWVSCFLAIIAAFVITRMAFMDIQEKYEVRKSQLEGKRKLIQQISQKQNHPNEKTITEIKSLTTDVSGRVMKAWVRLADDQQKKKKWPEVLGNDFLKMISKLQPGDEIPLIYRERYRDFIGKHIPSILDQFELRKQQRKKYIYDSSTGYIDFDRDAEGNFIWEDVGKETYIPPSSAVMRPNPDGTLPSREDDTRWVGNVEWKSPEILALMPKKTPTSEEIWNTQEDLWIYEELLGIVRETNKGIGNDFHKSPIKTILSMKIGEAASGAVDSAMGSSGGSSRGRYVRNSFQQFQQMPVALSLIVDQRRLSDVQVNCANSPIPIGVVEVSVDFKSGSSGMGKSTNFGSEAEDVTVEILGYINIFNTPDTAKLTAQVAKPGVIGTPTDDSKPLELKKMRYRGSRNE